MCTSRRGCPRQPPFAGTSRRATGPAPGHLQEETPPESEWATDGVCSVAEDVDWPHDEAREIMAMPSIAARAGDPIQRCVVVVPRNYHLNALLSYRPAKTAEVTFGRRGT